MLTAAGGDLTKRPEDEIKFTALVGKIEQARFHGDTRHHEAKFAITRFQLFGPNREYLESRDSFVDSGVELVQAGDKLVDVFFDERRRDVCLLERVVDSRPQGFPQDVVKADLPNHFCPSWAEVINR